MAKRSMNMGYAPTPQERALTLERGDFLKLSGDGTFATLQGEGASAGAPSVFLRLHGCNLKCGFAGQGWPCDAWYTWDRTTPEFWQEASNLPVEDVTSELRQKWQDNFSGLELDPRLVVTGGEPLLQQAKLLELLDQLQDWQVEIETNGTIVPDDGLRRCQINCSPKLQTSGNTLRARYRPQALQKIATFPNHWFKFVVTGGRDIEEIDGIVRDNNISYDRVLLMSEGTEAEKLRASDERLRTIANSLGCAVTARNHIFWFGDKRAT